MDRINLVIAQKADELKLLKQELNDALREPVDYEYVAILEPAIVETQREIERISKLVGAQKISKELDFPSYLKLLLAGQFKSLELYISSKDKHFGFKESILKITRLKQKSKLLCSISLNRVLLSHLNYDISNQLKHIGWKTSKAEKLFTISSVIKTEEDISSFHMFIARTLLCHFREIIHHANQHYYVLTK